MVDYYNVFYEAMKKIQVRKQIWFYFETWCYAQIYLVFMPNFEQCDRPVNHQKQFSGGGFFFVHSLERTVSFERKERDVPKKVFNAAVLVHSV